ncbi:MAG: UDP-N-acetylmuramoyl-L-alanine--D-glutamate ligase [Clostridia bacterium]|nr:UDP-N-acetylmuramoyl-L-alanine--D-glutamate ligase [Clostridia bacterium]
MLHGLLREKFSDKNIILLGFGVSNIPVAREFIKAGMGESVTVRDMKAFDELGDAAREFAAAGVKFECGIEPTKGFTCDTSRAVIFRSPGIRPDAGDLTAAVESGAILTSEVEFFCEHTSARIFAITGSDGKTTTSTLTSLLLKEGYKDGKIYLGGNIGTPLFPLLDEIGENDICVLELSSFQLMTMDSRARHAAITNITPNHLNWHIDMNEYAEAKYNVCGKSTARLVLNATDSYCRALASKTDTDKILFSAYKDNYTDLCDGITAKGIFLRDGKIILSDGETEEVLLVTSDIKLPGVHNIENYMTAIALTYGLVEDGAAQKVAKTFGGVEHRLEFVREKNGVKYYNSSIDSSPTRTIAALSTFKNKPTLIIGGRGKKTPYEGLARELFLRAGAVILTGETLDEVSEALASVASEYPDSELKIFKEEDFAACVKLAESVTPSGSAVLLSPAATSFDKFKNFAERGKVFKELVKNL